MATIIQVDNETKGTSTRMTKGGRRITYEMTVVQQPERARACGQGAKSSTDRRPVDPPPIVDLRVFEGEEGNKRDITCAWNANFFLFASLEQARPMAQGRVPPNASNSPVLTGTPVAGMSYLDRPAPAGYFIFPDLSVRHEGKYRLSFQLFEETRDEPDKDAVEPAPPVGGGTGETYFGRCQVKSQPFTVYSAKKFPGLAESTHLSRMVADQGCRVRIRRDVRMRRRDNKDSKDWDEYEEKTAGERPRSAASPEAPTQVTVSSPEQAAESAESRPTSNQAYGAAPDRHAPTHDMNPQYQQYQNPYVHQQQQQQQQHQQQQQQQQQQPGPPPPPHGYAPHVPYDPATMAQYQQAQYMHQQQVVQSPQQMHYPQYPYGYPPQPMVQYPQGYYMPQPQPPQQTPQQPPTSMYDQQMGHMRPEGIGYAPPPPPQPPQQYQSQTMAPPQYNNGQLASPFGTLAPGYTRMTQPASPTYPTPQSASSQTSHTKDLPPLKALEAFPAKYETPSPSVAVTNDRATAYPGYPTADVALPPQYVTSAPAASKRSYGAVFSTQHIDQPLRSGARPNLIGGPGQDFTMTSTGDDGSDEEIIDIESLKMQYRRADGTQISRRWPTAHV